MRPRRTRSPIPCLPSDSLDEPGDRLGESIFHELPRPEGSLVRQTAQEVSWWAIASFSERILYFTPTAAATRRSAILSAGIDPDLAEPLAGLVTRLGATAYADTGILATLCIQVARWAHARGATATPLVFARAAALLAPTNPRRALVTARLAIRAGSLVRGETWLRRAITVARRRGKAAPWAEAHVELGLLCRHRGEPARAKRAFLAALRAGRREGLRTCRADAYYGLMLLATDAGDLAAAERFGRRANAILASNAEPTPSVELDLATLWVRGFRYREALPTLERELSMMTDPAARARTLATLALAAAGAGDAPRSDDAWNEAWAIVRANPGSIGKAVFLHLAYAAAQRNDLRALGQAMKNVPPAIAEPTPGGGPTGRYDRNTGWA